MTTVIVAHGDIDDRDAALARMADHVIAADAGALALERWGIVPHVVVGDLDSLGAARADALRSRGVEVVAFPAEKAESDVELAIDMALRRPGDIVLLGVFGARLDHELANVMLVADPRYRGHRLRAVRGTTQLRALHGGERLAIDAPVGRIVTLLPVSGDARGIETAGLKYGLHDGTLVFGRSRGLSNVVVSHPASVSLANGILLIIEVEES